MNPDIQHKPVIPQPWLRVLLCAGAYGIIVFLLLVAFALVSKARAGDSGTPQTTAYMMYMLLSLLTVALVWLFRTKIDRRSFASLGTSIQGHLPLAGAGLFLSSFLLCTGSCLLFFSGSLLWTGTNFNGTDIFISLVLTACMAFAGEVFFRGYVLNNLLQQLNKWVALPVAAILYVLAYAFKAPFSVLATVNIFLMGCLLGLNYVYTGNLWFGIALNAGWNFIQGPLLGYHMMGLTGEPLLQHELKGSAVLTGGNAGFNASVIATVFLLVCIAALWLVFEKKYAAAIPEKEIVLS